MNQRPSKLLSILLWLLGRIENRQDNYGLFGDLEEMYHHMAATNRFKAGCWLGSQILRTLPAIVWNRFFWAIVMVKNYGKLAMRNLKKERLSSFINITGLSVAIGCSLVAFVFVDFYYNRDTNHENVEEIFLVGNVIKDQDSEQCWGDSPMPLGHALISDFSQIKQMVRIAKSSGTMRYLDKVFNEAIRFADPDFFDMFTYPMKYGEKTALSDRNSIILSEDIAIKYFGDINPVGKQVSIRFNNGQKEMFLIAGVTEEFHKNASFWFDIMIPFDKQLDLGVDDFLDWSQLTAATFISLENPSSAKQIAGQLDKYLHIQNNANPDRPMNQFYLESLQSMSRTAYKTRNTLVWVDLHPGQLYSMYFGGFFMLLQAILNFMNISIVSSTRRFKEIAVRKIVGSNRTQLIFQFLGENVVICLMSLIVGLFLGKFLFVPGFTNLWGVFQFEVNIFENTRILIFLLVLLVFTGVGSGLYPALYISAFRPVNILRNKQKIRGNNFLTKGLLTFQFICALMAVTNGIVFIQNAVYQKNRDWGYDKAQRLVLPLEGEDQYVQMRDLLERETNVTSLAGSVHHIGGRSARTSVQVLDDSYEVVRFAVGFEYVETMGLRLKEGRFFMKDSQKDKSQSVLVNECFVTAMHWDNAMGQKIMLNQKPVYVVGIVQDFHYATFMHEIEPVIMTIADQSEFNYLAILARPGSANAVMDKMKELWRVHFPDLPFMGFYQDQHFDYYNQMMDAVAKSSAGTSLIALLITCMGVLGMVSMDISRRMKEISIRKVLGASNIAVAGLVNKGFVRLIIVASFIAIPSSYFLINMFLDSLWKYHRTLDATPFIVALCVIVIAAFLTISSKVYQALVTNPVSFLRNE
ncbi:ABC transporter permease [bacterium]|nr:ABC transporter permease [bacterium]